MSGVNVVATRIIAAPADVVYELIADYRTGHPSILPQRYFENLIVEEGGRGAGTRIRFTMKLLGTRRISRANVTEPDPGRLLVETDVETGTTTKFIVARLDQGRTSVTFDTLYPTASGVRGWLESWLVRRYLIKVYDVELRQLERRALEQAATHSSHPH
jgi:hypothetical protein